MPLIDAPAPDAPPRFPIQRKWGRPGRPGANDRPVLPAGHPVTWGAITRGTVLDGVQYPFPVFWDGWDARPPTPDEPDEEEAP